MIYPPNFGWKIPCFIPYQTRAFNILQHDGHNDHKIHPHFDGFCMSWTQIILIVFENRNYRRSSYTPIDGLVDTIWRCVDVRVDVSLSIVPPARLSQILELCPRLFWHFVRREISDAPHNPLLYPPTNFSYPLSRTWRMVCCPKIAVWFTFSHPTAWPASHSWTEWNLIPTTFSNHWSVRTAFTATLFQSKRSHNHTIP